MNTTLVGVFVEGGGAQVAYWKLVGAGIDRGDIRMRRERPALEMRVPPEPSEPRVRQGVIGRLFAKLFGSDSDHAAAFAAAARRGHVVLTVVFDDETRVDELSNILEACGSVDVDERVEQWQGDGSMPPSRTRRSAEVKRRSVGLGFGAFDRRIGF